jgi:tetratricopeptide (TPR) repeat protein
VESDLAGTTIADRYDVLELVGAGGMGEVYRARDRELDEIVALKIIRTDRAADADLVARFRHEVKLARRVTHANVARTFELGNTFGLMFCTMELIEGESLARRLSTQRRLPIVEATGIASAVCAGLTAAHAADVIHRDIKPDNVLLASDRVVITDFGVASIRVRGDGELSGTPAYMAPEQARGEPPTPATDVYAVGMILYEMLVGRRAFGGELTQILTEKQEVERMVVEAGELPAALCDVISRATARDVAARYATAEELRIALEPWARPVRITTSPQRTSEPAELYRVVVLPPRAAGEDQSTLHLGKAVREELLARLSRRPRVRVLPRAAPEPHALVLEVVAGTELAVIASRDGIQVLTLAFPAAVELVEATAQLIADTAVTVLGSEAVAPRSPEQLRATDLLLRGRHLAGNLMRVEGAIALVKEAAALAPDDPRIAATLAMLEVRVAFFLPLVDNQVLIRASELARIALWRGPELGESHLAMGHVALHSGQPTLAAGHYRRAIACSPHSAEAHEYMGRLLLEAGFIDQGIARVDDALQISPNTYSCRWDLARVWALEQRWDLHEQQLEILGRMEGDRSIARARYAWWRGDLVAVKAMRSHVVNALSFEPRLVDALFSVLIDEDGWSRVRSALMAVALDESTPNRRRRAFIAQLVAEAASFAKDTAACAQILEFAYRQGLFDLHWFERCAMLDNFRGTPAYASLRGQLKERAQVILDALYGDHEAGTMTETAIAPSAIASPPPGRVPGSVPGR